MDQVIEYIVYEQRLDALFRETMAATHFVVNTNEVILNHSCRDMKVGASYVMYL